MNRFFDNIPIFKGVNGKLKLSMFIMWYAVILAAFFEQGHRGICVEAMMFSFLGDFFLNNRKLEEREKKEFYAGTVCFMIAHITYAMAYMMQIKENEYAVINTGFFMAVIMIAIVLILFTIITLLNKRKKSIIMYILSIVYVLIIGLNCSVIFSFSYSAQNIKSIAAVGALLFFASDLFIGIETFFDVKSKIIRELVWWFYPIGQFIIITMG